MDQRSRLADHATSGISGTSNLICGPAISAANVFAWKENNVIFCEAKRLKKDVLGMSQRKWIEAAINEGVALSSLLRTPDASNPAKIL
jgi:hypothetical protein